MLTRGLGHLAEPGFLVLVALLDGPKHGYAIGAQVEALTGKAPGPGTLYGAISRLEGLGLIEARPGEGRRKPYALTPDGEAEARARIAELDRLARQLRRRLGRTRGALA
jgi:DNA-binding PadR family transcriptional regulator